MAWGDVLRHPALRKALQEGEERLGRTVGKLLADERVASGAQRGIARALRAANVPSRGDVESLRRRIEELEAMLEGLRKKDRGGRGDGNGGGRPPPGAAGHR